jgi:hypothetical protein
VKHTGTMIIQIKTWRGMVFAGCSAQTLAEREFWLRLPAGYS